MPIKDIIQLAASIIFSIGVIAAGVGYALSQFRRGNRQDKEEVVSSADQLTNFWKEQVDGFKEIVKAQDEKIQALTREVGELRGQLSSERNQNEELKKIFQNRNPEMEQFMKYMVQATKDQAESHGKIIEVLTALHKMSSSNHALIQETNKDLKIEAVVSKK